jgi:hypothetical protein
MVGYTAPFPRKLHRHHRKLAIDALRTRSVEGLSQQFRLAGRVTFLALRWVDFAGNTLE